MDRSSASNNQAAAAESAATASGGESLQCQGQQLMILLTPEQMAYVRDQIKVRKASAEGLGADWKAYAGTGGVKLVLTADQVIELGRGMGLDDDDKMEEGESEDSEDYEDFYESEGPMMGPAEDEGGSSGKRKRGEDGEDGGAGAGSQPAKAAKTVGKGEGEGAGAAAREESGL